MQGVAVIVLAIPFGRYPDLASLFNDVPADVVVIDTSNADRRIKGANG